MFVVGFANLCEPNDAAASIPIHSHGTATTIGFDGATPTTRFHFEPPRVVSTCLRLHIHDGASPTTRFHFKPPRVVSTWLRLHIHNAYKYNCYFRQRQRWK